MPIGFTSYRSRPLPRTRRARSARFVLEEVSGDYIDSLKTKILSIRQVMASGVESAAYGDKRTEFRSFAELREILNGLEEELEEALGLGGKMRQIRMTTQSDKGL